MRDRTISPIARRESRRLSHPRLRLAAFMELAGICTWRTHVPKSRNRGPAATISPDRPDIVSLKQRRKTATWNESPRALGLLLEIEECIKAAVTRQTNRAEIVAIISEAKSREELNARRSRESTNVFLPSRCLAIVRLCQR